MEEAAEGKVVFVWKRHSGEVDTVRREGRAFYKQGGKG